MRFLGFDFRGRVPETKTTCRYRDALAQAGIRLPTDVGQNRVWREKRLARDADHAVHYGHRPRIGQRIMRPKAIAFWLTIAQELRAELAAPWPRRLSKIEDLTTKSALTRLAGLIGISLKWGISRKTDVPTSTAHAVCSIYISEFFNQTGSLRTFAAPAQIRQAEGPFLRKMNRDFAPVQDDGCTPHSDPAS